MGKFDIIADAVPDKDELVAALSELSRHVDFIFGQDSSFSVMGQGGGVFVSLLAMVNSSDLGRLIHSLKGHCYENKIKFTQEYKEDITNKNRLAHHVKAFDLPPVISECEAIAFAQMLVNYYQRREWDEEYRS